MPRQLNDVIKAIKEESAVMILKPSDLAEGRGIEIHNKVSTIIKSKAHLAQRYIMNPMLIDKKKFDFRIYVTVTSLNPLNIYIYTEGFLRKCSKEYSADASKINDKFIHLTNYEVQKKSGADKAEGNKDCDTDLSTVLGTLEAFRRSQPKEVMDKIWN